VEVNWILDAIRQFGVEPAMAVAKLAAERVDRGVVAFGIGGSETRGPAEWFTDVFAFAREAGLAPDGARRRGHQRRIHLGGARNWAPNASATGSPRRRMRRSCAPARKRHSAGDLHHQQSGHRRCKTHRRPPCAAAVRRRSADRAEYRRSSHVRLHAGRRVSACAERFGFSEAELRGIAENGFRYQKPPKRE
jgi:hypothetical protein